MMRSLGGGGLAGMMDGGKRKKKWSWYHLIEISYNILFLPLCCFDYYKDII